MRLNIRRQLPLPRTPLHTGRSRSRRSSRSPQTVEAPWLTLHQNHSLGTHLTQLHDAFSSDINHRIYGGGGPTFYTEGNGRFLQTANPTIQIVVLHSIMQRMMDLSHWPVLAGHTGGQKIYYRVKQHFHWSSLPADWYGTLFNCEQCDYNRLNLHKTVGTLKIRPSTAPLESSTEIF